MKLDNIFLGKPVAVKYHVLFWLSYFTFNVLRWGLHYDDYLTSLKDNAVEFSLHIALVYTNFLYLIPKFLLVKKYKQYFGLVFLMLVLFIFIRAELYHLTSWSADENFIHRAFAPKNIISVAIGELYVISFTMAIRLTIDWIRERSEIEELQKEQLKTELKFLKAQIQPHFFFNTLNNLYSLTLSKSDMAPNVVLKLSDIMQYVLYEIKEPRVRLLKEIEYIRSYIDLEKLRCHQDAKIGIEIKGNIDHIEIPPLLLLPFIENAFKHGNKYSKDFFLNIEFENQDDKFLIFSIENRYEKENIIKIKGGIGNKNVKKRLYLLFAHNFTLSFTRKNSSYKVLLKIPI